MSIGIIHRTWRWLTNQSLKIMPLTSKLKTGGLKINFCKVDHLLWIMKYL